MILYFKRLKLLSQGWLLYIVAGYPGKTNWEVVEGKHARCLLSVAMLMWKLLISSP